jgi:hypothetical protein
MSDDVHLLHSPAGLPKILLGKALYLAGFQLLKPTISLFITDVMWLRVKVFKQRRDKLGSFWKIELGCFLK